MRNRDLAIGLNTSLTFTGVGTITTGGAVGPPTPNVTDVLDAASNTADIAQGSIFIIKGSNLSASGYAAMSFPLPTSSGGVSIKFAPSGTGASGQGTSAYLVYLYNLNGVNQLAAVLPSSVTPGTYDVTVTYNNVTGTLPGVRVVQRKPELITGDSTGWPDTTGPIIAGQARQAWSAVTCSWRATRRAEMATVALCPTHGPGAPARAVGQHVIARCGIMTSRTLAGRGGRRPTHGAPLHG